MESKYELGLAKPASQTTESLQHSDSDRLLFLTLLLRGLLPKVGYVTYLHDRLKNVRLEDDDEEEEADPELECLSRLLCTLVRNKEAVAAIPVREDGKLDLIVSWNSGGYDTEPLGHGLESRLSEAMQPSGGEITDLTSHALVKEIFLANRGLSWESHANLVFHILKKATAADYEWSARYILLTNAEHTLGVLNHSLHWRDVFRQLTFREVNYDGLSTKNKFPYPTGTGLGKLLSNADISAIKNLFGIVAGARDAIFIPLVQAQSLPEFLDEYSGSGVTLVLNQDLLPQILTAIHCVFTTSLDIISGAYEMLLADPTRALGATYEHITSISFTFHDLLRGKFIDWAIDTASDEIFKHYGKIAGDVEKEGLNRIAVEQGPQIIGKKPRKFGFHDRECQSWLRSCFETVHNVEQVVKAPYLGQTKELRFLDVSRTSLASSINGRPSIAKNWQDIIYQLRRDYEKAHPDDYDVAPHEDLVTLLGFYSSQGTAGFEWANREDFVVQPELHPEVILATFYFAAMLGLKSEGTLTGPDVQNILALFRTSESTSIIGTSKPCCLTCTEIIRGLGRVLSRNHKQPLFLTWSHEIASPGTFPDIFPETVRSSVLGELNSQVFKLLRIAEATTLGLLDGSARDLARYRQQARANGKDGAAVSKDAR
ncbi:hypothetical protein BDN72DRAFT_841937 [Pluteus cervinus]|uniref:Uncharacterized protein n=1 Tax=Pluteus cervinus TaxID=181527 RepID=A0ACD3ATM6_9AGAR|nr:hypothetical protein BDN72DRAFT_841937 [Pluteus cervinus]